MWCQPRNIRDTSLTEYNNNGKWKINYESLQKFERNEKKECPSLHGYWSPISLQPKVKHYNLSSSPSGIRGALRLSAKLCLTASYLFISLRSSLCANPQNCTNVLMTRETYCLSNVDCVDVQLCGVQTMNILIMNQSVIDLCASFVTSFVI